MLRLIKVEYKRIKTLLTNILCDIYEKFAKLTEKKIKVDKLKAFYKENV